MLGKRKHMTDVCLMFEVHQPFRLNRNIHSELLTRQTIGKKDLFNLYFDDKLNRHVFERAAKKCYLPANNIILEQIDRLKHDRKQFKVAYGVSGVFLEQCERYSPDLLETFKQLVESGCVELMEELYYHSLASLYGQDKQEFIEQAKMHKQTLKDLFNYTPKVFENTECIYNNAVAKTVESLGYSAIVTEGVERVLGWRSPNYVYHAKDSRLKVLMRNYRLSDDIGFRFSSRWWNEWPLSASKYASWLAAAHGQAVMVFIDYETFGEHHWPETGIHEFLRWLPSEVNKWEHLHWRTPSEVAGAHSPVGEIDVFEYNTISWADLERDPSAWISNPMQVASYEFLKGLEPLVKGIGDPEFLRLWRYFQMSDHLYYMSTKGAGPGDVHSYFNPYGSPIEAFVIYSYSLSDFQARVLQELKKPPQIANWYMRRLPADKAFTFFHEFARPTGLVVYSLSEFKSALKHVEAASVEFHVERGDFERWIRHIVGDNTLADEFTKVAGEKLAGEKLRKRLLATVENRVKDLEALAKQPREGASP